MKISDAQLPTATDYVQQQFDAHSWWPQEQPEQAKHEFKLMNGSATALGLWCEKWLDAGQCRKLEKYLHGKA
jgi:hypothetical protein